MSRFQNPWEQTEEENTVDNKMFGYILISIAAVLVVGAGCVYFLNYWQ